MQPSVQRFADLIAPMDVATFREQIMGRSARQFSGDAARVQAIGWPQLTELLSMTHLWSAQTLSLVLDGRSVAAESYCRAGRNRDGDSVQSVDMAQVDALLARGATLVLDRVETLLPQIGPLVTSLRSVFGASVVCNLYCSFQAHQGFGTHYDSTDVIALHLAGSKRWRLYAGRAEHPMPLPGHHFADRPTAQVERERGALAQEVILSPGDVLYLPRGHYHDALATSEASLHLSFGITRATGVDVMNVVARSLPDEALLREELPHFDDLPATQAHLGRLGAHIARLLADPALAQQVVAWQRERVFAEQPSSSSLPQRQAAMPVRVCQRALRLVEEGGRVALVGGHEPLPLEPEWVPVVAALLEREVFLAADLVTVYAQSETAARALLDALAGVGAIEPLR